MDALIDLGNLETQLGSLTSFGMTAGGFAEANFSKRKRRRAAAFQKGLDHTMIPRSAGDDQVAERSRLKPDHLELTTENFFQISGYISKNADTDS